MCCNSLDDCHPTAPTAIQEAGYDDYRHFSWVLFLSILGCCVVLHVASVIFGVVKERALAVLASSDCAESEPVSERDNRYALDTIGADSVFRFFLTKQWWGWAIALITMGVQLWMCFVFVNGSEYTFPIPPGSKSDLEYTWKCPRDKDDCRDTKDRNWQGWTTFGILMFAHLFKDIINGGKLIVLSGKPRHSRVKRARFFFGGMFLVSTSTFILFVTTIYNQAIATSNTELIANAVIVLFISDLDEMMHTILVAINPSLVPKEDEVEGGGGQDVALRVVVSEMKDELEEVKKDNLQVKEELARVQSQMEQLCEKSEWMQFQMIVNGTPLFPAEEKKSKEPSSLEPSLQEISAVKEEHVQGQSRAPAATMGDRSSTGESSSLRRSSAPSS